MSRFRIKLKGIVNYQDKYLLVKRWYDDRISDPYQWEFIDTNLEFGGKPDDTILESVSSSTGLNVRIDRILYTWTYTVGETQYLGIAYQCEADDDTVFLSEDLNSHVWVKKEEFSDYIENKNILKDVLEGLGK